MIFSKLESRLGISVGLLRNALIFSLFLGGPALAEESFSEAIVGGEAHLNLRYRYEYVDQDGFSEQANASTLRARLNYTTGSYYGWLAFVEFDAIGEIFLDDFNSGAGTSPDRIQYPVVADPEGTELNQTYVQYSRENAIVRVGRQRINLDNQRFVGGVGWRQNEQTYDSVSVAYTPLEATAFFYAYINKVHRIFGDDVPAGNHHNNTHLLNLSHKFPIGKLTGYYYGIDNDEQADFSTDTFGISFSGSRKFGEMGLNYRFEAATQQDAGNNPVDFDATYFRADATLDLKPVDVLLGYERLEGDAQSSDGSFRTPLATLHPFNGWADKFLTTPSAGLEDLFAGFSGKIQAWKYQFIWHSFETEDDGVDLGDEVDIVVSRGFRERYGVTFRLARFDGDTSGPSDTTKAWFMLTAAF